VNRSILFGIVVCAGPVGQAYGQGLGWTIRAGGAFPGGTDVRNTFQNTGLLVGVGVDFPIDTAPFQLHPSVDIDFYRLEGNGNHVDSYSACFDVRMRLTSGGSFQPYIGAGAGVFHRMLTTGDNTAGGIEPNARINETSPGGKLIAGIMFDSRFSIEADYRMMTEGIGGANTNSLTVSLGYRF